MKKKLQKGLSLMLVFSLLMSLMSMSGFAVGSDDATSAQQIVANGQESSYADGKVKVSKMISGTNAENVFDITLNVETTQSYDTIIVTPPAAVALVIDTSASMDAQVSGVEDGKTVTKTRLYWAKKAAAEFLEEFADPNGAARYVSLSEFYRVGYAKSSGGQYWFNVSDATERAKLVGLINSLVCENHSGTNVEAGLLMAEDLLNDSPVKNLEHKFLLVLSDGAPNAVSTAMPSGGYVAGEYNGTYNNNPEWDKTKYDSLPLFDDWAGYSGGGKEIYVPNNVPDGSEEHEDKVDTMDNDGYYMGWYWKSTTNGTGGNWPNSGTPATTWEKVEMTGYSNPYLYAAYRAYKAAQDIGATIPIYTLNYGSAGEQIGANEANWNFSTNYSVSDWLKYHIASKPDNAFGRGDSDDVAELFTSILGEIKEELTKYAQAWTVTDPMGERVEYIANSAATNDGSVSYNNGTLTWTLADPAQRVDGNKTYYTYSATYQVKLDNVTPGSDSLAAFAEGNVYATNGTTTLTYWLMVDENGSQYYVDENGAKINGDPSLTANFVVPSVKGYLADLTFKKVNEEKAALAGAVFTLSGENGFSQEATSDENGTVSFTGIPSGYSYTLAEKTAPDGYDKTESTYTVTVSYDTVSVAGVSDLANFQIANQKTYVPVPPKHTITATKVVDGATLAAGQFSFQLLDAQGNVLQTKTNEADGSVTFDKIDYATAGVGTYTYTVKEFVPASVPENWTYDNTEYTVIVVVNQDADTGEYSKAVTVNGVENGPISFTNSYYVPQHEGGSITVTKITNGNTTPADAKFQLEKKVGENNWAAVGDPVRYSAFEANAETGAMEYTFANLTEGTYRVVETNADGISNYSWTVSYGDNVELVKTPVGSKGDTQVSSGAITVTNTYTEHKGSLKITKTFTGAQVSVNPVFTVKNSAGETVETVQYSQFTNGVYTKSNLPLDTYTVTESGVEVDGYTHSFGECVWSDSISANGDVAEVSIINNYTKNEPDKGSLTITKTIVGLNDEGKAELASELTFTITGPDGFSETVPYSNFSTEGTYTRGNLVVGEYTVTESNYNVDGYRLTVTPEAKTAQVTKNGEASVSFTNTYAKEVGSLKITKTFTGNPESVDPTFTVKNSAGDAVATVKYSEFSNGTYHVIGNLPLGNYTVEESNFGISGYEVNNTPNYGDGNTAANVTFGGTAEVVINNVYTRTPTPNLVIDKEADVQSANVGDTITYTITVKNTGNATAKNAVVTDTPDANLELVASSVKDGTYADGKASWQITLVEGAEWSTTVKAVVKATDATKVVNTAAVDGSSDTEETPLTGSLTISKTISGLDKETKKTLIEGKGDEAGLTFTITGPNGYERVVTYKEFSGIKEDGEYTNGGTYTLTGLEDGIYTIVENKAEVGGGYDLAVTADDADAEATGYQIEVGGDEQKAVTFAITNSYTGRVYNIWFDGGAHGIVYNAENTVYRNRWLEFGEGSDAYYDWSGFGLKASGDTLYQLGSSATDKIYAGVTAENDPAISEILSNANDTRNMVMYTLTWKDYMEHTSSMQAKWVKPTLVVDKGWVSDKAFYHNGGAVAFQKLEDTLVAMNSYIDGVAAASETGDTVQPVYVDANGYYHIYYVAKYTQYKTPTGNLTINKTATGAEVPVGATFTISGTTVDQEPYTTSFTYQNMANGTKTITLPQGTYTVTETGANVSGYTLSTTVNYGEGAESAVVAEEVNAVVDVVNTYTKKSTGGGGGSIIIPEPPVIEIPEEDVPLVDIPDEEIPVTDLPEEDIPLADVPKTGETMIYRIMAAISGITLMALAVTGRKKEEEEMA